MGKLLAKIFIKNHRDFEDPKVRAAYGILSGAVGIVSNLLLSGAKIVFGILIGSIAVLADGINNLSDAGTSLITLIGFKMSSRPADKDHPHGHQRLEYVTGLILTLAIIAVGGALLKSSVEKIIHPTDLNVDLFTLIMLGAAILVKLWQSFFYRANGKLIKSRTLFAAAADSRNDCLQTAAVLSACLVFRFFGVNIDGYVGLLVSALIIFGSAKLIKQMASALIGEAPQSEFVERVREEIQSYSGILGVHDIIIHSYGPKKAYVTAHAEVDAAVDVRESHYLLDQIERDFLERHGLDLLLHLDPVDTDKETERYRQLTEEVLRTIDERLDYHDFRISKEEGETKLFFDVVMPSGLQMGENELRAEISKRLKERDDSLNPIITIDLHF